MPCCSSTSCTPSSALAPPKARSMPANILKPPLARGELQCIGATTLDEYRKYIERDAALERRFQPVMVEEPTVEQTIDILMGIRERYEQHHKVTISDAAVRAAADLSTRYITDRHLPDKAIDLIDEAASRVRLRNFERRRPPCARPRRTSNGSPRRRTRRSTTRSTRRRPRCASPRRPPRESVDALRTEWQSSMSGDLPVVDDEEIAQVVAMWTGIPVTRIAQEESERLLHMEDALHGRGRRPAGGHRDRLEGRSPAPAPGSRTRSGPSARSSSWARPASARPSWPRPSPSSCSAARTRSSRST